MALLLLLVRHAHPDHTPGRLYGRLPGVHLSESGEREAKELAGRLSELSIKAVYSSPMERCMETAEALAEPHGLGVEGAEGLAEVDYGTWQNRTFRSLTKTKLWRKVQLHPSQVTFPEGESIRTLQSRAVEAIEGIRGRHKRGTVLAVSHADVIKTILAHYLGMPLDLFQRLWVEQASVTAISFGDGFPRVLRMGDTGSYQAYKPPKRGKR